MILCDPFAINTLSLSTIRHLQELVSQETLPRVSIVMAAGCAKRVPPACETESHSIGGHWHREPHGTRSSGPGSGKQRACFAQ